MRLEDDEEEQQRLRGRFLEITVGPRPIPHAEELVANGAAPAAAVAIECPVPEPEAVAGLQITAREEALKEAEDFIRLQVEELIKRKERLDAREKAFNDWVDRETKSLKAFDKKLEEHRQRQNKGEERLVKKANEFSQVLNERQESLRDWERQLLAKEKRVNQEEVKLGEKAMDFDEGMSIREARVHEREEKIEHAEELLRRDLEQRREREDRLREREERLEYAGIPDSRPFIAPVEEPNAYSRIEACHINGQLIRDMNFAPQVLACLDYYSTDEGVAERNARPNVREPSGVTLGRDDWDKSLEQRKDDVRVRGMPLEESKNLFDEVADQYRKPGMRARFLSAKTVQDGNLDEYELVKKPNGDPAKCCTMFLGHIPEHVAVARAKAYQKRANQMLNELNKNYRDEGGATARTDQ